VVSSSSWEVKNLSAVSFNLEDKALKEQLRYYNFPEIGRYASQKNVFQDEVENLGA
jgi:hypothetical protein